MSQFDERRVSRLYAEALPSTRSGALFNAFSYPTKISPEAIALFIATHTAPGATVLDPFAGSGTTGIAAKLCARPTPGMVAEAARLGIDAKWGPRNAVLYELSTIGSQLARTMCSPPNPHEFELAAQSLVKGAGAALGWMYESVAPDGRQGHIRHVIWSDLLICPHCGTKTTFWDACVRLNPASINDAFVCEGCKRSVQQSRCDRDVERIADAVLFGDEREVRRRVPVRVHGVTGGVKWQRGVLESDLDLIYRVSHQVLNTWVPTNNIYWGDLYRSGYHQGIQRYHHFYTHRNLSVLSYLWHAINAYPGDLQPALRLLVLSFNASHSTLMTRVVAKKRQNDLVLTGAQSGVLYVSSLPVEKNILEGIKRKIKTFKEAFSATYELPGTVQVVNASSTRLALGDRSIDYVFTDPPFGAYIPYSELNQVNEAWLDTLTNRAEEAIVSSAQGKDVDCYKSLLEQVFAEVARVIDPSGAATIVFHSSKPAVWNAARSALVGAGLEVAATNVLNKTQVSFKQANSGTSSRGDALILVRGGSGESAERPLPISNLRALQRVFARAELVRDTAELQRERLYSRYAAYCIQHGLELSLNTAAVYALAKAVNEISAEGATSAALTSADQKRLGQYFSGGKVAMLLAALCRREIAASVIDPMAGTGDMLVAALAVGLSPERIAAVEIEDSAFRRCLSRLEALHLDGHHDVTKGNAFDPELMERLSLESWDLVITNPPYVRYQTGSASSGALDLPSANEVRGGLKRILSNAASSDSEYARFLLEKSQTYSGLADLAVPAWLLCAALVRPGGTLAMVVPDAWLTRDYAAPIRELLFKFFEIEFLVEDGDVSWFSKALVRTNLLVAHRRQPDSVAGPGLRARLSCRAASSQSLVGAIFEREDPEVVFAVEARKWLAEGMGPSLPGCDFEVSDLGACSRYRDISKQEAGLQLPASINSLVDSPMRTVATFRELGWSVGQGLRTGANLFFYVEVLDDDGENALVRTHGYGGEHELLSVPSAVVRRVVRRQADLPTNRLINPKFLAGGVLVLEGFARRTDRGNVPLKQWLRFFSEMPSSIASLVAGAEIKNIGSEAAPRFIPGLSAVKTNVRQFDPLLPDRAPRFWYHLPIFAQRHLPDLIIARINHRHPRVVLNPGRTVLIDANFSTLWASTAAALDPYAMMAVLSSSWMAAVFESSATPMGGGALKLEATHIRRLPLPIVAEHSKSDLAELGAELANGGNDGAAIRMIDEIVFNSLGLCSDVRQAISDLARRMLEARTL